MGFVDVGDGDANVDAGAATLAVDDANGHRVGVLRFLVVCDAFFRAQLSSDGANGETVRITTSKVVCKAVAISISGRDRVTDGPTCRSVLFHGPCDGRCRDKDRRPVDRFAKTVGEFHKVVKSNFTIGVLVVFGVILFVSLPRAKSAGKGHEVREIHKPVPVEVRDWRRCLRRK